MVLGFSLSKQYCQLQMCFITVSTRTIVTTTIIMIVILIKINDLPCFCIKAIWKDKAEWQKWKQRMEVGLLISPNWIFVGWIDLKGVQKSGIHIIQTLFHLIKTVFEVPCLQTTCSFENWSHRKASLMVHSYDMPEKNKTRKGRGPWKSILNQDIFQSPFYPCLC